MNINFIKYAELLQVLHLEPILFCLFVVLWAMCSGVRTANSHESRHNTILALLIKINP